MEEKKITKKLGTDKVFKNNNGKIKIGTTNKFDCKAIYIRLETWVTPEESLQTSIEAIRRRFIANIHNLSNIYFEGVKTYLIDYDYALIKENDKPGKKSFINIEITLLAENRFEYNKDLIFDGEMFGDNLFTLLETLSNHFTMCSSKK